ncbi:uncharacterized protein LOC127845255 [Dreissena polymorpha]|nr:uncharacterized protein LOC127845255 [Dreissena polymorpha]
MGHKKLAFNKMCSRRFLVYSGVLLLPIIVIFLYTSTHYVYPRLIVPSSGARYIITTTLQQHTSERMSSNMTISKTFSIKINSQCANLMTLQSATFSETTWLPADDKNDTFVFSAFYDSKDSQVFLVGLTSGGVHSTCQMWYMSDDGTAFVMEESGLLVFKSLPETHDKRYAATLFKCVSQLKRKPTYISVAENSCRQPSSLIVVKSTDTPQTYQRRFTLCLMPIHNNYNDSYALVQWIELNHLLGADKFVVYNYSSASNIGIILDMYTKRNIIEVVQWPIPVKDVHYFGQVAALQDCLYRNKHDSEFVVNVDLDEFIIPLKENITTWAQLIDHLNGGAFIFRNSFYLMSSGNKTFYNISFAEKFHLSTLLMSRRERKLWLHKQRSKYIVRTSKATSLMIHEVPALPSDARETLMPEDDAIVQHFRNSDEHVSLEQTVADVTIRDKYGQQLIANVQRAWENIKRGV